MPLLLPGLSSTRQTRSSKLAVGWRSIDGVLEPYTGQVALFTTTAGPAISPVVGLNAVSISGGTGMPRFMHDTLGNVTRLEVRGDSASFDVERYAIGATLPVQALSILLRVVSMYTKGSNQASARAVFTWGADVNVSGGTWSISRMGTGWQASRSRGGTTISGTVTEPGTITYPVDVLVTMSAAGAQNISTRDAVGVTATASASTSAAMVTAGETLTGIGLGCSLIGGVTGGWYRVEALKIARGVQTFAAMDLLT